MKKFTKAAMFLTAVSIGLVGCGQAKTKTAEIPSRESSQGEKQKDVGTGEDSAAEGKYDLSGVEPITLSVTSALSLNHGCW